MSCSIEFQWESLIYWFYFKAYFHFKNSKAILKDSDCYYNCLYHVFVFSIDNVTKTYSFFVFAYQIIILNCKLPNSKKKKSKIKNTTIYRPEIYQLSSITLARPKINSKWPICMTKLFCLNENRKLLKLHAFVNPSTPFTWNVISFIECAFGLSWWLGNWHVWTINLIGIYKNVHKYHFENKYACDQMFYFRKWKAV